MTLGRSVFCYLGYDIKWQQHVPAIHQYISVCACIYLSLQSPAVEQVLDILMEILSWEIAEVVSLCLPRGL